MQLESFQTHGYGGLVNRTWRFVNGAGAPTTTLVTGTTGKTNLLRAIALAKEALGPYGRPRFPDLRRRLEPKDGFVEIVLRLSDEERASLDEVPGIEEGRITVRVSARDEVPPVDVRVANLLATWSERGVVFLPGPRAVLTALAAPVVSDDACDEAPTKYAGVVARLGKMAEEDRQTTSELLSLTGVVTTADDADQLAALRHAVAPVIGPRFVGMVRDRGVDRALFEAPGRARIGIDELSRRERSAFLVAATLLFAKNRHGVVLIDDVFDGVDDEATPGWFDWIRKVSGGAQLIAAADQPASRAIAGVSVVETRTA